MGSVGGMKRECRIRWAVCVYVCMSMLIAVDDVLLFRPLKSDGMGSRMSAFAASPCLIRAVLGSENLGEHACMLDLPLVKIL